MELNPFEARLIKNFFMDDPCENLDVFVRDLKEVNSWGWYFNPWYHRIGNWMVVKFTPATKIDPAYEWNIFDDDYVGPERRGAVRGFLDDFLTGVKRSAVMAMMPKTKKTEHLENVA